MRVEATNVAKEAFRQYRSLKKTGKPVTGEWTHLAVIVQCSRSTSSCRAVALGTGSKCLSHNRLSLRGETVHDSHAEVLARRCFLRYLYDQLRKFYSEPRPSDCIFQLDSNDAEHRCQVLPDLYFQMFVSHSPCGDAAIIESEEEEETSPNIKRARLERTGAHCCPGEAQDGSYETSQVLSVLRTKPGKGERTLSLSCSDKLMRWHCLGLQGALLSHFIVAPLRLEALVVAKCPRNAKSLNRAINCRLENTGLAPPKPLEIIFSSTEFFDGPSNGGDRPSPASITWWLGGAQEVLVGGRRQGVTKKCRHSPTGWPGVAPFHLLRELVQLFPKARPGQLPDWFCGPSTTYLAAKEGHEGTVERRKMFLSLFPNWEVTPRHFYEFSIESVENPIKS